MGKRYWVGVVEGKPHAEMCIDGYAQGQIACVTVFTKKADAAKRYEEIREVSLEPVDRGGEP